MFCFHHTKKKSLEMVCKDCVFWSSLPVCQFKMVSLD